MEYINSRNDIAWGDYYFLNHVAPSDFNHKLHKKELSKFWESKGFKCSMMFDDFYSQFTGVHSDRYIPMDIYYFYILPCLNRFDFRLAYTDKNMYRTIFPNLNQPETIVKCMNGCYYIGDTQYSSFQMVIETLLSVKHECIIKPTVDSCNGVGIAKLKYSDVEGLKDILASYGKNYIVQKKVKQHSEMARLNTSSLNTLRVFTYRTLDGVIHYMEGKTFGRFGGTDSVMDNGSAGGGLIKVNDDGTVDDKIVFFNRMAHGSLEKDKGIKNFVIPRFADIKKLVVKQHENLPHFDFIGWDISIEENGIPIFIEFNIEPSIEGPQMISGPFFGNYFDDMLERLIGAKKVKSNCYRNVFKNGFEYQQIVNK